MKMTNKLSAIGFGVMLCILGNAVIVPAEESVPQVKTIISGTDNLKGGQHDFVWFGNYQQTSLGDSEPDEGAVGADWIESSEAIKNGYGKYYRIEPVKWRVLSNADNNVLLLADKNLDIFPYHTEREAVTYEKSAVRSWLNGYGSEYNTADTDGDMSTTEDANSGKDYSTDGFIHNIFTAAETDAVAVSEVINQAYSNTDENAPNPLYPEISGGNNTADKVFLLSASEVLNSGFGFADDKTRSTVSTDYVLGGGSTGQRNNNSVNGLDWWWLRTPGGNIIGEDNERAAVVTIPGDVEYDGNFVEIGANAIRPGINLDSAAVLFSSAAAGGKNAAGMESAITEVTAGNISEWKLTVLDESRKAFKARKIAAEDGKITVAYNNAVTGDNEYISAIIKNSADEITHYGRIAKPIAADGTVQIDLSGIDMSENSLYIFNEQYNGDYKTDFAGNLIDVSKSGEEITEFRITAFGADGKSVQVEIPSAGRYTVIFADYEGLKLDSVAVVEKDFGEGMHTVTAEGDIALEAGDVIMLWDNMSGQKPLCDSLEIIQ